MILVHIAYRLVHLTNQKKLDQSLNLNIHFPPPPCETELQKAPYIFNCNGTVPLSSLLVRMKVQCQSFLLHIPASPGPHPILDLPSDAKMKKPDTQCPPMILWLSFQRTLFVVSIKPGRLPPKPTKWNCLLFGYKFISKTKIGWKNWGDKGPQSYMQL